jgi:hypothetical protein
MSNVNIYQNKSQMFLQYPVTCCGAQSVWQLQAELASKNVHEVVET